MLSRTVIYLISETEDTNDYKDPTVIKSEKKVFADELEIGASEFYQAANSDLKPVVKFKIRYAEYNNEVRMRHGNSTYRIMKTYSKDKEFIELTGDDKQNGGNI